jgi:hypothetical protein
MTTTTTTIRKLTRRLLAIPETPIASDWIIAAATGRSVETRHGASPIGDIESFARHAAEESERIQRIARDLASLPPAGRPTGSVL